MAGLALVFPGQGAQKVGMGRDFFDAEACARDVFTEASDALSLDVAQLCFEDAERLALTEFAQPAILTVEIAMLSVLRERFGTAPEHFGGHSLGEYTALVAAGVMPVGKAAALVRERGRLMQEAVPVGAGGMLAVIKPDLDFDALAAAIEGLDVDAANMNATNQVVIAGTQAGLDAAKERIGASEALARAKCMPLKVSAPFHSRLMAPVRDAFAPKLEAEAASWTPAEAGRVTSNFTGGFHDADAASIADALARQIDGPVRWLDNMRALVDASDRIVELGPGRPLRGFFGSLGLRPDAVSTLDSAAEVFG